MTSANTGQVAVTDRAIQQIKAMIASGQLRPGDRLPPEKQLSEKIGVSRNSLREAVRALSVLKILDVRQGDGTYVTSLEPELLTYAIGFTLDVHPDTAVVDIMAVRRLLEPAAVGMATPHLTHEDLQSLRDLMAPLSEDTEINTLVQADITFHHLINRRCGNPYLTSLLDAFATSTASGRLWRGLHENEAIRRTLDEHHRILEALESGHADLAATYAAAHVAGVETWLRHDPVPAFDPELDAADPAGQPAEAAQAHDDDAAG